LRNPFAVAPAARPLVDLFPQPVAQSADSVLAGDTGRLADRRRNPPRILEQLARRRGRDLDRGADLAELLHPDVAEVKATRQVDRVEAESPYPGRQLDDHLDPPASGGRQLNGIVFGETPTAVHVEHGRKRCLEVVRKLERQRGPAGRIPSTAR